MAVGHLAFAVGVISLAAREGGVLIGIGIALLPAALTAWVFLMAFKARIVADETGLSVVNCLSARRLSWDDVVAAEPGYGGIVISLRDGTAVVARAVQKANIAVWLRRGTRADEVAAYISERGCGTPLRPL